MIRIATVQTVLFVGVIAGVGALAALNVRSFSRPARVEVVNGTLATAFESHYEAVFPAKQLGINLWAALEYKLFHEGRPGVVVGTRGWLYTSEEFSVGEHYRVNVRRNLATINAVQRELAASNAALVVSVVPAKARVYAEYLANRRPAQGQAGLYEELLASLAAANIPAVDLRNTLAGGKTLRPTYLQTDTHWTPWGARLAAFEIARVARRSQLLPAAATVFVTRATSVTAHSGDLVNFLPLAPWFGGFLPPVEPIRVTTTEPLQNKVPGEVAAADLFGDATLPQVVLIGTSYSADPAWNFSGSLSEALGENVANYARAGGGPFHPMEDYLRGDDFRAHPARLVVWEIPERSLIVDYTSDRPAANSAL